MIGERWNTKRAQKQNSMKIALACREIEAAEQEPNLQTLARSAGMSPFQFHRMFSRLIGLTPKAYAKARRAERVRHALVKGHPVTRAAYDAGYNSSGRFYEEATRVLGMKPKKFAQKGAGETIRFAVGECSLGSVLVAASQKGVCAIFLGNDPQALVRELQDRFARAELVGGDKKFERLVAAVVAFVESPATGLELPLDIRGTAFQERVWAALRKIPIGATASYAEIARRLGVPKAVRAVAGACAANPIALAIPCHRVVRTNGALSGYRWGVERKGVLLEREQHAR